MKLFDIAKQKVLKTSFSELAKKNSVEVIPEFSYL